MAERISVIIPAYNESDIIGDTISAVLAIPEVYQLIVVDDASTDNTAEIAKRSGADKVIRLNVNSGKGNALNKGFAETSGNIILLLDADLGKTANQACKLINPVIDDTADMTIGRFNNDNGNNSGKLAAKSRGFGTVVKITRFAIKVLTGKQLSAPLSGQRAIKREIIERAGGFASGYGVEAGLSIDALRMNYRVSEIFVDMMHRPSGRDIKGFIHRGKQLIDILRILILKAFFR